MATINVTGPEFEQLVLKDGIVFVDFWAAWCGPCRMFAPIFEASSEKYPEISFAKVDTDAEQELSGAAGITSIPTLMAFRDGVLVFRQAGALPAPNFEELITAVQNIDMDAVRAEIAKEESQK
jgi:thioredoxin 1